MADDKAPKKRGRPAMEPLASGADVTFASAATVEMVAPAIPAAETLPVEALPAQTAPAAVAEPVPSPEPAPAAAPEPSVADLAMTKPAPVHAVATPPAPAPASIDANPDQAPVEPSKGQTDMATAFPTAPVAETAEKAKAMFGDMNSRAKTAMEKSVKLGEEMTELTKGNVEAIVQSGRVAAKGAEALAQDAAETMKKHFESATATMKSFASVKSPTELFQLQSDAAKSYFDTAVADMSKFTEQMMKLAGDVAQPISSRYSVAMEKAKASAL